MDAVSQSLFNELVSVMEEEGISADQIKMETKLKELELSSMQFLRVVGALEDLLGIPLDAGLGDVDTVGGLIGELKKLKDAQG
jgi:acyl carrier protein